jgi:hypothetical protein
MADGRSQGDCVIGPTLTPFFVKGSNDFYGMNHYCANFIRAKTGEPDINDIAGNRSLSHLSSFRNPMADGRSQGDCVIGPTLTPFLSSWTPEDIALVKGSNDFYGMNHYCANFIRAKTGEPLEQFPEPNGRWAQPRRLCDRPDTHAVLVFEQELHLSKAAMTSTA